MDCTKTGRDLCVPLADGVLEVLRHHIATFRWRKQSKSDLLFPSRTGGCLARSVLDKPFADVAAALGFEKKITARAMRRTHKDLARRANVGNLVSKRLSGHETDAMHEHYATVGVDELRAAAMAIAVLLHV